MKDFKISSEYTSICLVPPSSHAFYLHLKDLAEELKAYSNLGKIRILDYGCGGSPYREFFPEAEYIRADFSHVENIDHRLPENSIVPEPDNSFDLIISTQVLEHLRFPEIYLQECSRLLKLGGKLLLSTHGTFMDHGCPYDFQRWTADGLIRDIEKYNIKKSKCQKLTCNVRAMQVLFASNIGSIRANGNVSKLIFGIFRKTARALIPFLNILIDKKCQQDAARDSSDAEAKLYIALLFYGIKS